MKFKNQKPRGFVTIVSLLIVASIAMFFALNMLLDGLENANLSTESMRYETARINALTCLEDSLLRMKQSDTFDRDLDYALSADNECSTDLTLFAEVGVLPGLTEQLATLLVTGFSQGFTRTFEYQLKIKKFDVNNSDGSLSYLKTIDFISVQET